MHKKITCLFCQTENEYLLGDKGQNLSLETKQQCKQCGMELPEKHPNDRQFKVKFFVKAFWLIALFCLIMVFYLPR